MQSKYDKSQDQMTREKKTGEKNYCQKLLIFDLNFGTKIKYLNVWHLSKHVFSFLYSSNTMLFVALVHEYVLVALFCVATSSLNIFRNIFAFRMIWAEEKNTNHNILAVIHRNELSMATAILCKKQRFVEILWVFFDGMYFFLSLLSNCEPFHCFASIFSQKTNAMLFLPLFSYPLLFLHLKIIQGKSFNAFNQ